MISTLWIVVVVVAVVVVVGVRDAKRTVDEWIKMKMKNVESSLTADLLFGFPVAARSSGHTSSFLPVTSARPPVFPLTDWLTILAEFIGTTTHRLPHWANEWRLCYCRQSESRNCKDAYPRTLGNWGYAIVFACAPPRLWRQCGEITRSFLCARIFLVYILMFYYISRYSGDDELWYSILDSLTCFTLRYSHLTNSALGITDILWMIGPQGTLDRIL